jgi:hypothetical protein
MKRIIPGTTIMTMPIVNPIQCHRFTVVFPPISNDELPAQGDYAIVRKPDAGMALLGFIQDSRNEAIDDLIRLSQQ